MLDIPTDVHSVYDGDTLTVIAYPWPGMTIKTGVRVRGVDTPEIRGKCDAEKSAAIQARDAAKLFVGDRVRLLNIELGKYAGRVVADVVTEDNASLAEFLISSGLGRPYDGGRRLPWCE